MNKLTFLLLLSLTALLISSCGAGRRATREGALRKTTAPAVMEKLVRAQVSAEWMDARAKLDYAGRDMSVSGNAQIKLHRDSVIWISVKKFGFEVARAQVTQDSIYILDRINNEYAVEPLSYIEKRFRLPARFDLLQNVLLGNPIFFTKELALLIEEQQYRLQGRTTAWETDYWVSPETFRLTRMRLADRQENRAVDLTLDNYTSTGSKNIAFAYERLLRVNGGETGEATIGIEFSDVILNEPTEIRFEIPDRYERRTK